ncbi:MAG: hypothetical protein AAF135_04620 [Bacteroidota bacterium]
MIKTTCPFPPKEILSLPMLGFSLYIMALTLYIRMAQNPEKVLMMVA